MYVDYDPDLAAIGAIEPEFVEEFDYHATKKVVRDGELEVSWISEISSQSPVKAMPYHYEDCDINVYKTVLKWRSCLDSAASEMASPPIIRGETEWLDDPRRGLPLRSEWR